jgi:hypothetical protein
MKVLFSGGGTVCRGNYGGVLSVFVLGVKVQRTFGGSVEITEYHGENTERDLSCEY